MGIFKFWLLRAFESAGEDQLLISSLSSGWRYQEVKGMEQEENPGHRDDHTEVGGLRTEARAYPPESLDACQTRRFLSLFW